MHVTKEAILKVIRQLLSKKAMEMTHFFFIGYLLTLYLALNWALGRICPAKFSLFRGNTHRAKQILDQLMKLIAHHKQWQIEGGPGKLSIPQYKFYTTILQSILHYSVQFGAPITEHLKNLRKCLIEDWEFEQKLSTHLLSTIGQISSITLVTWCFGFFCQWILQLWPRPQDLWLVGGLQVAGGATFFLLYQKRKIHLFHPYEKCYRTLISAAILQQLGISLHQVIAQCGLNDLPKGGD